MEQNSNNILPYKHISNSTDDALMYIDDKRKGLIKGLITRWPKFNRRLGGGIEPANIITIAGISGSGKSSIANNIETDLVDLNPNENLIILSFSFEMVSSRQVGRKISSKLKQTTNQLYSGEKKIKDEEYDLIVKTAEDIKKYPIYYVDKAGTVGDIDKTIAHFQETIAKNKWLIVMIDHTLLINGRSGESEREIIAELQKVLIVRKKVGKTSIIQLSQLNRNIESPERVNNPFLHYPQRGDLSSSDSVFQASDVVIVIHRPEILGLSFYGPNNMSVKDLVYLHFLKNREGKLSILRFINDLQFNNLKEPEEDDEKLQQEITFTQ